MTDKFIPEHIDFVRFAEQRLKLDGIVNIADMRRLSSSIYSTDGNVAVNLEFGIDEQGLNYLKGHIKTELVLQCQRCMEPLTYEIMSDFALGIVETLDDANSLPEHYEPAMAKEGKLALRELIEDEIILNLPIIPKHSPDQCKVKLPLTDAGWEEGTSRNPFTVLESLKTKQK